MTFGDECNCGNCTKYSESKEIDNAHPGRHVDVFCLCDGEYIPPEQVRCTKRKGCLSHPRAREALMAGVVEELEMRLKKQSKESDRTCAGAIGYNSTLFMRSRGIEHGYEEALDLIRGGGGE